MTSPISLNSLNHYEFKILGQPDASWLSWFGEPEVRTEGLEVDNQTTTISKVVMDQAGLVGLIRRLHGLGIVLISIRMM